MPASRRFTDEVRQELGRLPLEGVDAARAELAGLLRTAGLVTLPGGGSGRGVLTVASSSGAVARRAHALVLTGYGERPELRVRSGGGVRNAPRYAVVVVATAARVGVDLALWDDQGRLRSTLPADLVAGHAVALVRGALLGGGSVSGPGRPAHLEVAVGDTEVAEALAEVVGQLVGAPARVVAGERPRVVLKSGERIGALLATVGATGSYLALDEGQLRRQLRGEANRLANADQANLRRTIEASFAQVADVERAIEVVGWDGLTDELRDVALVRLANPEASLTELGSLVDPPIGKSAVHRRLQRLAELGRRPPDTAEGGPVTP